MLIDKIRKEIEKVDILTDFDEVMIKGQSPYVQIFAYFLHLDNHDRISLIKRLVKSHKDYKKDKDVSTFYSILAGCPVEVIDKTVSKYKQNKRWDKVINKLNLGKVGVISRNNDRIIVRYLNLKKLEESFIETRVIAANNPEIKDDIYTGNVELIVNNDNLVDFVKEKDYICGREEKEILENSGINSIKIDNGLYICTKQKIF